MLHQTWMFTSLSLETIFYRSSSSMPSDSDATVGTVDAVGGSEGAAVPSNLFGGSMMTRLMEPSGMRFNPVR